MALNIGSSFYHSVQAIYWRDARGNLLAVEGLCSDSFKNYWPEIWRQLNTRSQDEFKTMLLPSGRSIRSMEIIQSWSGDQSHPAPKYFQEKMFGTLEDCERPIVTIQESVDKKNPDKLIGIAKVHTQPFSESFNLKTWAAIYVLLETRFLPLNRMSNSINDEAKEISNKIADIFNRTLRNISKDDQWLKGGGREYFSDRVFGFVERKLKIEFCLPAFPCKSPNPQKVRGIYPDKGEKIALDVFRSFIREVTTIYEPGAKIWIISDGHVFSDCIGVDDSIVDLYGERLKENYKKFSLLGNEEPDITFRSLWELFFSDEEITKMFSREWVDHLKIPHPIETTLTDKADLCRKLMMEICGIDRDMLRKSILSQQESTIKLYRGISRFMLDDLAAHKGCIKLSTRKRKKLASKVASEMILRNQAYSNLVELLFPSFIRLSIHAHSNSGPKFGIRLFPEPEVRAIESLKTLDEKSLAFEFQTPTPWHNCIISVDGDQKLYLAKSRVAYEALGEDYEGAWMELNGDGQFKLSCNRATAPPALGKIIEQPFVKDQSSKKNTAALPAKNVVQLLMMLWYSMLSRLLKLYRMVFCRLTSFLESPTKFLRGFRP